MFLSSLITPVILIVLYATFLANVYKDSFCLHCRIPYRFLTNWSTERWRHSLRRHFCLWAVSQWHSAWTWRWCRILRTVREKILMCPRWKICDFSGILSFNITQFPDGQRTGTGCLPYLYVQNGLVHERDGCTLGDFGWDPSGIIWLCTLKYHLLSAENTGADVGSRNDRECRLWIYMRCVYANLNFDTGLQKVLSILPGTYGTSLLKNHMLRGIFEEMSANGFPDEVVTAIGDSLDCNPVFGDMS